MHKDRDLKQNILESTETHTYTIAQGSATEEAIASSDGLFELLLIGMVSLAGFYALYKKSSLYLDRASRPRRNILKKFSQPNCANCRFFDRNLTLKCRLHPVRVSSQQKADCTDYWHQDSHKFLHR